MSMPRGKLERVTEARPPDRDALPRRVGPDVKVTVPVAVVVGDATIAVSFTDCPAVEGFFDDVRLVVVTACVITWLNIPTLVACCGLPL